MVIRQDPAPNST